MLTDITTLLIALTLVWFTYTAVSYSISALTRKRQISPNKALENKLLPHKIFYQGIVLISLIALHYGLSRHWIFTAMYLPFLAVLLSIGLVFQKKHNPDKIT